MTLAVGQRLGRFEVVASLGAGGMGEVYRARDTKLGREVALKVLPKAVSGSAERRARFEREAKLLATLNHPLIASLYEVQDHEDGDVLVMELVEGETLADRLGHGALPLKRALEVGRQVAEALEGAHDRGILHRDLKPANIMLTPTGGVKLLDFGLATAVSAPAEPEAETVTRSPRVDDTAPGVALGTLPYMSPEQARGEQQDRRTDAWAFGCVLYEMLAGRRAFSGPTRSEVLAAVLEKEPDWEKLPANTPVKVQDLLHRCLHKDRLRRLRDIGDARLELQEALEESEVGRSGPRSAAPARKQVRLPLVIGLVLLPLLIVLGWWAWPRPAGVLGLSTLTIPAGLRLCGDLVQTLVLAPDAGSVVYCAWSEGKRRLFIQDLNELAPRLLVDDASNPTYSPDGRWLAFLQGGELRKTAVAGGSPSTICPLAEARGLSWGPDDRIVYSPGSMSGLWSVPASGGEPEMLTTPNPERREISHRWPEVLPDGKHALFTVHPRSLNEDDGKLAVLSLATRQWKVVVDGSLFGRYLPSGHVLHGRRGSLFATPLDLGRLALTGPAVEVASDVKMESWGTGQTLVATSSRGGLAYVPGFVRPEPRSLLWVDRTGRATPVTSRRLPFVSAALSPDAGTVVASIDEGPGSRLEKLDVREGTWVRVALGLRNAGGTAALYSPDGRSIVLDSDEGGLWGFYRMPADLSEAPERLLTPPLNPVLGGWSPDGKGLIFAMADPASWWDLWTVRLEGDRQLRLFLKTPAWEMAPTFTPDGRYVAHLSEESGTRELVIRPFPGPGPSKQVSVGGAQEPLWSRDGRELFYRSRGKNPKVMSAKVATRPTLVVETPRALFDDVYHRGPYSSINPASFAVTADGQRFLMIEQPQEPEPPRQIVVIPNFAEVVKEKLRAASR